MIIQLNVEKYNWSAVNNGRYCLKIELPLISEQPLKLSEESPTITELLLASIKGALYVNIPDLYIINDNGFIFVSDGGLAYIADKFSINLSKFKSINNSVIDNKQLFEKTQLVNQELENLKEELSYCLKAPDFE